MYRFLYRLSCLVALLCAATNVIAQEPSIGVIRSGYTQYLESLGTIHAKYELRVVNLSSGKLSEPFEVAEWIAEGVNWRFRRNLGEHGPIVRDGFFDARDIVVNDGRQSVLIQIVNDGKVDAQATIKHESADSPAFSDLRSRLLFTLIDRPQLTVDQALNQLDSNHQETIEDGLFRVQLRPEEDTIARIWFDPKRNFMVQRTEIEYSKNPRVALIRQVVVEAAEAKPGVWFPRMADMTVFARSDKGEVITPTGGTRTILTDLRINDPLPKDAFVVSYPEGTEVSDEITGQLVFWGKDGPATKPIPLPKLQVAAPLVDDHTARSSIRTWLVAACLGAVVAMVVYLLLRRPITIGAGLHQSQS